MSSLLKDNYIKRTLVLAILIRLLIMPFYYHPDIKVYNFQSSFFKKGVFNIYDYLNAHKNELPYKEEFVYFPLTYYFLGTYQLLVTPLLGNGFDKWLFNASAESVEQIGVFRYLFILKLPYLIADIFIGFLLTEFFNEYKNKKKIFTFWLLNPFSIFIIYVFSNVDILVVLMTLLSLFFAQRNKLVLAALSLGVGAGFKAYPILFLPLLFFYSQRFKERLLILFAGLGSLAFILLPFVKSQAFLHDALISGLTTRILIPNISLGFGEMILVPIFFLAIFFGWFVVKENKNFKDLLITYLGTLLIIFSFIHFHIQWLLWFLPFLCLTLVRQKRLLNIAVLLTFLGLLVPMLYNDKYMNVSLLNVINLSFSLLPNFYSIVQKFYDPLILQSIIHTVFAGLAMVLLWEFSKSKDEI